MKNKIVYILLAVSLILNIANFAYTYSMGEKIRESFSGVAEILIDVVNTNNLDLEGLESMDKQNDL